MKQNIDMIDITTNNFEKYKCAIPVDLTDEELKNLEAVNMIHTNSSFNHYFFMNGSLLKFHKFM